MLYQNAFLLLLLLPFTKAAPMIESNEVSVDDSNLQVQTNYGTVEGFSHTTPGGVKADIFLGIPYAEPPVDDLRLEVKIAKILYL